MKEDVNNTSFSIHTDFGDTFVISLFLAEYLTRALVYNCVCHDNLSIEQAQNTKQ